MREIKSESYSYDVKDKIIVPYDTFRYHSNNPLTILAFDFRSKFNIHN